MTKKELDKACDAYCLVCKERDTDCFEYCKGLPSKAECNAITDFRKAMGAVIKESLSTVQNAPETVIKENLTTVLTWQDVKRIVNIADEILRSHKDSHGVIWDEERYYKEVLKLFQKD